VNFFISRKNGFAAACMNGRETRTKLIIALSVIRRREVQYSVGYDSRALSTWWTRTGSSNISPSNGTYEDRVKVYVIGSAHNKSHGMYANDMRQLVTRHRDYKESKPEVVLFHAGSCLPLSHKRMCMAWCIGLFLILNDDNICNNNQVISTSGHCPSYWVFSRR